MFYTLKRPTEIDWFDLFQLEHPDRAIDLITQMCGPRFQGQSIMQLISGLDKLCPDGHINPHVVESALRSGEFFLVPFSDAQSPMLRQAITFHTDSGKNNPTKSEWLLSTNTFSDHLTSTLHYLIDQTPKPIFVSAAVRQNAKAGSAAGKQNTQAQQKDVYWVQLTCNYGNADRSISEGLPYKVTFSDGTSKSGKLGDRPVYLKDIPQGEVKAEFGYPEEIK